MYIADKKNLNLDYFAHAHAIKEKYEYNKLHDEARVRAFMESDKLKESRKLTMEEHEAVKKNNELDMDKEVDKKMAFIKKNMNLNLNII